MLLDAADSLRQILDIGKFAGRGSLAEVRGQLAEYAASRRITVRLCFLGGGSELLRNLFCHLFVLRGIRLLKALQTAHQPGKSGNPPAVRLQGERRCIDIAQGGVGGLTPVPLTAALPSIDCK